MKTFATDSLAEQIVEHLSLQHSLSLPSLLSARSSSSQIIEQKYREIVKSLPAAVYTCDAKGRINFYNEAAAALWGRNPHLNEEELCGSYKIFTPDGKLVPLETSPMALTLRGEELPSGIEIVIERLDGTRRNVLPHLKLIRDESGKTVGALNMLVDITDRKRAELELAEIKDDLAFQVDALTRLHQLSMKLSGSVELTPNLQAIVETLVEIHSADYGFLSLYDGSSGHLYDGASVGFDEQAMKTVGRIMPGPEVGACGSSFSTRKRVIVQDVRTDPLFGEFREIAKSLGFRAVHSTPILTQAGKILGVLSVHFKEVRQPTEREIQFADMCAGYAADIIEAVQAQQALLESEQQLRKVNNELEERVKERTLQLEAQSNRLRALTHQLTTTEQRERKRIAAILHDHLQQILVACSFQLAEISRRFKDTQLTEIPQHITRGRDLLAEAIHAARSLSVELRPPVLYEAGFIQAFKWLAKKFETEQGLKINLDLEEFDMPLDDSLKILIFESVKELLFNIVKHARVKEARLIFKLIANNILYFCVEDRGVGFSGLQEKHNSENQRGFGLFGIRERLKLVNASFDIASEPQEGSKIEIKIPINSLFLKTNTENSTPEMTNENREFIKISAGKLIKILLVDDHKLVREGIANILKEKQIFQIVAQADNGREAVEKTTTFEPDVVIMDVNMPELNGIDATRLIKKKFPRTQIIGLSVQDEEGVVDSMKKAGALTLLNKAGDPEDLVKTILHCMNV